MTETPGRTSWDLQAGINPRSWPEEVRKATRDLRQGLLVESPPLIYAAEAGYPIHATTQAWAGSSKASSGAVNLISPELRPEYGLIVTQTCDLVEEGSPKRPWIHIAPVYVFAGDKGQCSQIERGRVALVQADALGRGRGNYALQAAIAQCRATAPEVEATDWARIVLLYEALGRLAPSPVVELNRAVAVSMATGPATALEMVDRLAATGALRGSHLLPSVRAELLSRLGRMEEAREEFLSAAGLARNDREKEVLERRAASV